VGQRQQIINAAIEVFSFSKADYVTMDKIAQQAGIKTADLNQHFTNIDVLWKTAVKTILDEINQQIISITKHTESHLPNDEAIRLAISEFTDFIARRPQITRIIMLEDEAYNWRREWMLNETVFSFHAIMKYIIQMGQADGTFRTGDPSHLAFALTGMLNWQFIFPASYKEYSKKDAYSPAEISEIKAIALDFILDGTAEITAK
jgi:AcrR family transcriptional regulator